ncbi:uncharacterized protein RSE6_03163 [Rhynchosporium secalis]|uniref:Uncharacterized protein n=1 Tax=Rhynchosporium secalis TaxID=38038 RepID=A0A1E1M253_RHYSE|nr:uncharacterized protein RSE6_03163 [Rhynchosporium secalis]
MSSQGLKVRDLVDSQQQSVTAPARIYWPIQAPTVTIVDLVSLQTPPVEPNGLRMSFFDCNAAHTTGYSMATNGASIATIHTHDQKMDLTFYQEVDAFFGRSMVWIYMPMDQDEYVTEVCRRFGFRHVRPDSLGLMFTTNQKRTTLFGSYRPPPSSNADYQFDRIYTPPRNSSRIYFNEWDSISTGNEIKFLGFEHTEKPVSRAYPKSLIPISLGFQTTYNEPWFYSFCSMKDVMKITLCIDKTAGHKPIIGMLLNYSNKHCACVGQYRLDWVLKPFEVNQARKLHIGIKRTTKGFPYVADISMHAPIDCSSTSWLDVSWSGTLEWSFSHRQCKLYYNSNQERS